MICSKWRKLDIEHFTVPKPEITAMPLFLPPEDDISAEEYRSDSSKDEAAIIENPAILRQV